MYIPNLAFEIIKRNTWFIIGLYSGSYSQCLFFLFLSTVLLVRIALIHVHLVLTVAMGVLTSSFMHRFSLEIVHVVDKSRLLFLLNEGK